MHNLTLPTDGKQAASSCSCATSRACFPPQLTSRRRNHTPPPRGMALLRAAVAVCLLVGMLPLVHGIQVTVVCADLVGAGGVGIRVWPTLKASPERHSKSLQFRLLQVNWEAERLLEGDWVGVFDEDPRPPHLRPPPSPLPASSNRGWRTPQPLFWDTPFATQGTITTNYSQPRIELSVLARGGCVGPYVGFVRNGVGVAAECLASHPTWLYDHRAVLGSRSLRSLVLPGTHNAGSYTLADDNDVVAAWVVCQDEDIISQLLYGNRYLDLRVAYYPDTRELLWINHDLVRWRPLQEVLDDVRGFLALSPDPVIIDIHRTPVGFNLPESMELLLSLMNATLGEHFVYSRHGPHVSLDALWQMGKRVIFTFNDPIVSDHTPWVWPPIPQAWANAQLLDDLKSFLDSQMSKRFESPRFWAAMAHLTPSLWDLLFRSHVGVRGMTDRVSFSITRWLRQRWGHMTNIIASDFFRGNDIINVAIRTNLAMSMCRAADPSRHPYTLRWTTELTLRSGSPTTIPPIVRRMYSEGAIWTTTGVRHIHYPFIPVDTNISTVFSAISTRRPSVVPGVTYQNNGDTWREIFHYPTDRSPQPPEAGTTLRFARLPSTHTTIFSTTTESSPKVSVESIKSERININGHDHPDEKIPDGMKDAKLANITDPQTGSDFSEGPAFNSGSILPSFGPQTEDTSRLFTIQGSVVNRLPVTPPLPSSMGDREPPVDLIITDLLTPTSNTMEYNVSMLPITGNEDENAYLFHTNTAQEDNATSFLVNDFKQEEYLMSATITAYLNMSLSSTDSATQDLHSLPSMENQTNDNTSSIFASNHTYNDNDVVIIDGINSTHSPPERDYLLLYPTQGFPQDDLKQDTMPSKKSGNRKGEVLWNFDNVPPRAESTTEEPWRDDVTLPHQQTSEYLREKSQLLKHSAEQTSTPSTATHPTSPKVFAHNVPVTTPVQIIHRGVTSRTSTVTVEPEITSMRAEPPASTYILAQIVTPAGATQTLVSDVTAGKSSSQVT